MSVPASLLPELEEVVQHGSAEKRAETLRRITTSVSRRRGQFSDEHVALFDDVIGCLIEEIEAKALAELARRLAPVPNAPARRGDDARQERRYRGCRPGAQAGHVSTTPISYISPRPRARRICWRCPRASASARRWRTSWCGAATARWRAASPPITRRSCRRTRSPRWSSAPSSDGVLAEKVGLRTDIPPRLFRQLLMQASDVVQKRLLAQAKPETQAEIRRVLAKVTDEVAAKAAPRNYTAALAAVQRAAQGAQAHRGRHRRLCQERQIRRDHRRARHDQRGAGRSGGPADERRARRSGADPGARGRLRLADGARDHECAARPEAVAPDARCRRARISSG